MPEKNLFSLLGISPDANDRQIKDAYRKLAKIFHPDVNQDDPSADERFKEVAHAYWILSDHERRITYLKSFPLSSKPPKQKKPRPSQKRPPKSKPEPPKLSPKEGGDIVVRMFLTLEELADGIMTMLMYNRKLLCIPCEGTGIAGGAKSSLCPACKGTGKVPDLIHTDARQVGSLMACRKCGGSGLQPMKACPNCEGQGRTMHDVQIKVGIPPGASEKDDIVVKGQGHEGALGGKTGNLRIAINEKPHRYLIRHIDDLYYHCSITFTQWFEGCDLTVPTLNGTVSVAIESGQAPEGTLRVRKRGMPKQDGDHGDLIIKYSLSIPKSLSKKQRSLLKKIESTEGFSPQTDDDGFFPRIVD
jgi:molecular chaperone DnaJ